VAPSSIASSTKVTPRLSELIVRLLRRLGWTVQLEVSFSHFGERGSIDILAWHAATRSLLVIEIKTELASVEGLLRPLDVKVRLAATVAAERFGWRAASVSRLVVLPEDSAARRAVARHERVFASALPARSREVRRWLAQPDAALAGLWFLSGAPSMSTTRNPSAVQRVRGRRAP